MNKETVLRNLTLYVQIEAFTKEEHYHAIRGIRHPSLDTTFNIVPRLLIAQNLLYINDSVRNFAVGTDHFVNRFCNRVFLNATVKLTKTKHLTTNGRHIAVRQHNALGRNYSSAESPATHTSTKQLFYLTTELDWTELCRHPQKYDYKDLRTELHRAKYGAHRTTPLLPASNRPKILQ